MKLILHIVRKDFRRMRWPLAGWLTVVLARLGIGFSLVLKGGFGGMTDLQLDSLTGALLALDLLLTFVLTAMLVQEDALVGETQFWLTRPISGMRLLAGKLTGWFLLLWLPAFAVTLPWWLTCGFGGREIFWAALEMFALQLAVSAPAALVAAVTDSLSRFLLWAFVLVFAVGTAPMVLMTLVASRSQIAASLAGVVGGLAVLLLTAVGVLVRQYRRRGLVSSVVWLGGGAALSVLVAAAFPGGLITSSLKPKWTDWHSERVEGVTLAQWSSYADKPIANRSEVWLHTEFEVKGLPPELAVSGGQTGTQTWRWPDGPVITRSMWVNAYAGLGSLRKALGMAEPQRDEETEKYEAQRQAEYHAKFGLGQNRQPSPPAWAEVQADLLPSMLTRIQRTPPAYEATVQLRLLRPEIWSEVSVNIFGWQAHAAHGIHVGKFLFKDEPGKMSASKSAEVDLPLVATMPDFLWDETFEQNWFDWRNRGGLYIVNRVGRDVQSSSLSSDPRVTIASVGIRRETVQIWQPKVRRGDKWVLRDPNWLAGVTVAMVGFSEEARFTREVKVERYEVAK